MAAQQISLHSSRLDAPAVSTLIHHAGVQHDPVLAGRRHGTAVRFADLADGGNFIGTGAQLSGQGNLIPDLQGMDLADAVNAGKAYLTGALAAGLNMGKGSGPVNHMWQY